MDRAVKIPTRTTGFDRHRSWDAGSRIGRSDIVVLEPEHKELVLNNGPPPNNDCVDSRCDNGRTLVDSSGSHVPVPARGHRRVYSLGDWRLSSWLPVPLAVVAVTTRAQVHTAAVQQLLFESAPFQSGTHRLFGVDADSLIALAFEVQRWAEDYAEG